MSVTGHSMNRKGSRAAGICCYFFVAFTSSSDRNTLPNCRHPPPGKVSSYSNLLVRLLV